MGPETWQRRSNKQAKKQVENRSVFILFLHNSTPVSKPRTSIEYVPWLICDVIATDLSARGQYKTREDKRYGCEFSQIKWNFGGETEPDASVPERRQEIWMQPPLCRSIAHFINPINRITLQLSSRRNDCKNFDYPTQKIGSVGDEVGLKLSS